MESVFTIEQLRPIRDGFYHIQSTKLGNTTKVTLFSLGKDTSISQKAMTV